MFVNTHLINFFDFEGRIIDGYKRGNFLTLPLPFLRPSFPINMPTGVAFSCLPPYTSDGASIFRITFRNCTAKRIAVKLTASRSAIGSAMYTAVVRSTGSTAGSR